MASAPLFVSSGDLIADRRYQWAIDQASRGDLLAAVEILVQTVALAPGFATAWFALGAMRDVMGDRDGAVAAFRNARDADPQDYHGARLQLVRLNAGEATAEMTETYVRRLFDEYAPDFDRALTERLHYRGPELLRDAVESERRAAGQPPRFRRLLDLGCGTGLAGAAFRPLADELIGVDVSPGMIDEARAKAVYDRLDVAELVQFLDLQAAMAARFDLVLAADVFVYVSDLAPAAAAVARVLPPDGLFAFTLETHAGEGVLLGASLRYAHSADHVRAALAGAGLAPLRLDPASPRTEKGVPVSGLLVIAARADAAVAAAPLVAARP
jgi:predicted TPR repeat methyltransferase